MFEFLNIPFDYAFGPLLALPTIWAVIILSILISLITTLIYKWTTNQQLMKDLKDEIKRLQSEAKTLKDQPQKAMEVQKQAMETNMKYMSHSMRPTIITFIPIILIFGWMSAVFAFESLQPGEQFSVTAAFEKNAAGIASITAPKELEIIGGINQTIQSGKATWNLKGAKEGKYPFEITYNGETQDHEVLITSTSKYSPAVEKTKGQIKSIQVNYKKLTVIPIGFRDWLGWLGTYIISSIAFTMGLRKLLKVY